MHLLRLTAALAPGLLLVASCASPHARRGAGSVPLDPPTDARFIQDVAWSPDGLAIAYSEYSVGTIGQPGRWAIWVADADGANARVLVEHASWVGWGPDGKSLVFGAVRDENTDIYSIASDGTDLRRLTSAPGVDSAPSWSAATGLIAFASESQGDTDISTMNADGSGVRRLTGKEGRDLNPAWSPDGTRIVFGRDRYDGKDQIHTIDADGKDERSITDDDSNNFFPCYLPDGRIGFTSAEAMRPKVINSIGADGSNREIVGPEGAFFARWSPDGRTIAFIAGTWPRSALYLMDADGTNVRKIEN